MGQLTQYRRLAGILASSSGRLYPVPAFLLNAWKRPLESSSARIAPAVEQREILSTVSRHPILAATTAVALAKVKLRAQEVLYPFRKMQMDPLLSIQTRTGCH
jgi:hypothetical protein